MAISGLSRVRTELLQLLVIPFLAHHPEQLHSQAASHGDFRNLPSAPQYQMKRTFRRPSRFSTNWTSARTMESTKRVISRRAAIAVPTFPAPRMPIFIAIVFKQPIQSNTFTWSEFVCQRSSSMTPASGRQTLGTVACLHRVPAPT